MRENLITVREAASYLRISARTVYRLIESGQIVKEGTCAALMQDRAVKEAYLSL